MNKSPSKTEEKFWHYITIAIFFSAFLGGLINLISYINTGEISYNSKGLQFRDVEALIMTLSSIIFGVIFTSMGIKGIRNINKAKNE